MASASTWASGRNKASLEEPYSGGSNANSYRHSALIEILFEGFKESFCENISSGTPRFRLNVEVFSNLSPLSKLIAHDLLNWNGLVPTNSEYLKVI